MLATLMILPLLAWADDKPARDEAAISECLARVEAVHGGGGPWTIAGYPMGERALKELRLPRQASTSWSSTAPRPRSSIRASPTASRPRRALVLQL